MNLLEIRAEALKANIDKIKSHLETMPDRRVQLDVLKTHLAKMSASLNKAQKTIVIAEIDIQATTPEVSKALAEAVEQMKNVVLELQRASEDIAKMRKECFRIQETDVGKKIAEDLNRRTSEAIDNLKAALQNPANLQQQWNTFLTTASDVNQSIFAEYVEFLGGLALRDTGFDEGISRVADELLRTYSTKKLLDPMLAIPTRRQAVAMTLARIIRVTFPDWTIWALPSTAQEFWHVVAQKELAGSVRSELRLVTGNNADDVEPRFSDCLADAFATYTMGPAYAFFAIFLSLDPSSPFTSGQLPAHRQFQPEPPADDVRAHSIFEMLTCMDSKEAEFNPPYADVRQQLSEAWRDAIIQTGAQADSDQEKQLAADKLRASALVKAIWRTLQDSAFPPFTADVWNEIKKWVEPLIQSNVDSIKVPHGAELRHALNAAWLARVSPARPPIKDITKAANDLAKKITDLGSARTSADAVARNN